MTVVELMVVGDVGDDAASLAELGVVRSVPCTVLEVSVRDQSALYGLLQRLATLGLELLELRTVPSGGRAELEIIVRGPIGAVLRAMLREVDRSSPADVTSYRVEKADLDAVLGVLDELATSAPPVDVEAAQPHAPPRAEAADATIARLQELARLRDQGVLTEDEFAAQKSRVLGGSA